jgi:O-antigen/teichoic acid export membrane protein
VDESSPVQVFPRKGNASSTAVLFAGTVAGQLIALLFAPALTRLYEPGTFGSYAVFTSILSVIAVVATLRFDLAIPVAKTEPDASALAVLATGAIGLACIVAAVVAALSGALFSIENEFYTALYIGLLPLAVLLMAWSQVAAFVATRQKAFSQLALSRLVASLFGSITQTVLGLFQFGVIGLVSGFLTGIAAGILVFYRLLYSTIVRFFVSGQRDRLREVAKEYRAFPLYSTWGALLNVLSYHLPLLIISRIFGSVITGYFSLSSRFIFIPLQLIGAAVGQVFLGNAAAAFKERRLAAMVLRLFTILSGIALIVVLPCGCLAPEAFQLVFGAEWAPAGRFASYLTPWLAVLLTGTPLSSVTVVTHRQRGEMKFQVILFASRCATLLIAPRFVGADVTIALFAGISALLWLFYNGWILMLAEVDLTAVGEVLAKGFLMTIPALFYAYWLKGTVLAPGGGRIAAGLGFVLLLGGLSLVYRRMVMKHVH